MQSSIVTSSTLLPGRACARREAIDRPEAPPAQPRPNTGTRATSERKSHPAEDPCLQARRRDPGGRDRDDGVDVAAGEVGVCQRLFGDVDEQRLGAFEKGFGAFRPAARLEIPVERFYGVALDDAGVGENAGEAFEFGKAGAEAVPRRGQNILLQ